MIVIIKLLSLMLVVLAFAACTNVTGPSCHAKAGGGASTSGSGNADGVQAGADGSGSSEAGCTGGTIVQG